MRNPNAPHIDFGFLRGVIPINEKILPSNIDMAYGISGHFLFGEWKQYCKDNDIEIVDEVKAEIDKFIKLIQTESVIEAKHINARLVFGDETLESVSNRWKLDYKE